MSWKVEVTHWKNRKEKKSYSLCIPKRKRSWILEKKFNQSLFWEFLCMYISLYIYLLILYATITCPWVWQSPKYLSLTTSTLLRFQSFNSTLALHVTVFSSITKSLFWDAVSDEENISLRMSWHVLNSISDFPPDFLM